MLSSNECSEVGEFAAESPELQGIYSNIYLHQTLMLFTFRINLLLKQSLGEIEVLGAWSLKCIFVLQMLARSRLGLNLIAKDNFFL